MAVEMNVKESTPKNPQHQKHLIQQIQPHQNPLPQKSWRMDFNDQKQPQSKKESLQEIFMKKRKNLTKKYNKNKKPKKKKKKA